jgi:Na+-transporting methylmalonyl-CoA/oxaloacetate decarboxylase gamma subunit
VYESNYKLVGYVYDAGQVTNVTVTLDGTSYAATIKPTNETVIVNGVKYHVYKWCYQFSDLKTGQHTLNVTAFDDRGMETATTLSFEVSSSGGSNNNPGGGGAIIVGGMDLWMIITIILLIVVAIMGAMLAKKPKAAAPEEEPVEEEETPAEEENEEEPVEENEEEEEVGGEEE